MRHGFAMLLVASVVAGCAVPEGALAPIGGSSRAAVTDGSVEWESSGSYNGTDLAWGDVDGDGDLDLAVAVAGGVDRLFLSGPTGLTSVWQSPTSEATNGIALGDVTGDGLLDLVTCGSSEPVRVYEGDGAGGFTTLWDDGAQTRNYTDIAIADLDGDGLLDLAVSVYWGVDRTFVNLGAGIFVDGEAIPPNSPSLGVAAGDLDGDGYVDLVFARAPDSEAYLNEGDGGFDDSWSDGGLDSARSVALGDFDGDGVLDLALGRNGGNELRTGDGAGGFNYSDTQFLANTWDLAFADHDGDGLLDLAVANDGNDELFEGTAGGFGSEAWDDNNGDSDALAWGDYDGDGAPELAVAEYGGEIRVYGNDGLGVAQTWVAPSSIDGKRIAWGDADGDGDLDLAVASNSVGDQIWLNAGDGTFSLGSITSVAEITRAVAWGDLDGDGDLDLATGAKNTPNRVYLNNGSGGLTLAWSSPESDDTHDVALGDFDGDGDLDLAVASNYDPNRLYLNDGTGTFTLFWSSSESERTHSVDWADFDGDGDLDLVVGNRTGVNRVYLGDGSTLTLAWASPDTRDTKEMAVGDLDGDGDIDLVSGNEDEKDQIWLNDGSGAFSLSWSSSESERTRGIEVADLDGDGDMDVAVAHDDAPLTLFVNQGPGSWTEVMHASVPNGRGLAVADADGDGDPDIAFSEGAEPISLYSSMGVGGQRLPDDPTHPVLLPPGTAAWVPGPGGPVIEGPTVPVPFLIVDAESDPAASVRLEYSLLGGADWTPATVTGATTDLPSSPTGVPHSLLWDVAADGVFSERVGVRIVVERQVPRLVSGPIVKGAMASDSLWRVTACDPLDGDGDGADCGADCDDTNPAVLPGAAEIPDDGIDQDCSGSDAVSCFVDNDGDGAGGTSSLVDPDGDCTGPGQAPFADDCDDTDAALSPSATEIVGDGIDQDCNGADTVTCFVDADGDTFGGASTLLADDGGCADPGEAATSTDCDDQVASVYPGAPEFCDGIDQDCDGDLVEGFLNTDGDAWPNCFDDDDDDDGYVDGLDCAPTDPFSYPGGVEICDGIDQDCDGDLVETFADVNSNGVPDCIEADNDGDGFSAADCDDGDASIFPGATEVPNDGIDQDCNGADTVSCFADGDGDGVGAAVVLAVDGDCADPGESSVGGDCDDTLASVFPGAAEVPDDGIDQDCSGVDATSCFVDQDGDGVGSGTTLVSADGDCSDGGESSVTGDCNDGAAGVYPGATEIVDDGIDQDCSGADAVTCFVDGDGDGVGGTGTVVGPDGDCADPGEASVGGDCDDASPSVFPGANEIPDDGIDQDCSGSDVVTCFIDGDGDGYGGAGTQLSYDGDCNDPGETSVPGDCNDALGTTFPTAPELCDGVDQDCDGDLAETFTDTDGDGEPNCYDDDDDGDGFVDGGDCGPLNAAVYPGAPELCDGIDQDCDGDLVETFADTNNNAVPDCAEVDNDGDGYSFDDCDDGDAAVFPGAVEIADDGIDQDCSGADSVTCFVDGDGDGVGQGMTVATDGDCDNVGEAYGGGDCDDTVPTVFPGAPETPDDGVDQDCNGADATMCLMDADGDGYGGTDFVLAPDGDCLDVGEATLGGDCDDADPGRNPAQPELCDAIDQDCDGDLVEAFLDTDNDGLPDCAETIDGDGDGYIGTDCDDEDPNVHPGAGEIPSDGIDQDCNGADTVICFPDLDGDGFGALTGSAADPDGVCDEGRVLLTGDCDDGDWEVNPLAQERCNGIDDDCDGELSPVEQNDADGDGSPTCVDCDDEDPVVGHNLPEDCADGFDNDCDGLVDGEDSGCDGLLDNDGDGWCPNGEDLNGDGDCSDEGEASLGEELDCDDADPLRAPDAEELCDGIDSDCTDDAVLEADADGDGQRLCEGDCDDANPFAYLGAEESCADGVDEDCDGSETAEFDDPDCWQSGCACSADPEPSPGAALVLLPLVLLLGRRRVSWALLAGLLLAPSVLVAAPREPEVVSLVRRAVDAGRCQDALEQARLLTSAAPEDPELARLHGDAARCAGRAREAVLAYGRVRDLGAADESLDVMVLSLQRSLGVVQVTLEPHGTALPWVRLRLERGDAPEVIEGAEVGPRLLRFGDLPADVPITMLVGGKGLQREEVSLPPLTPGEMLEQTVTAEWAGAGSLALARDLTGVEVSAEEDRGRLKLSMTPSELTAGRVPLTVTGRFGSVNTSFEVPRGDGGAIFDPLPYLPASVDLLHLPAGARVRVVVETPDGKALSRSFTLAADAGELDNSTGARIVDRLAMDSLTGGSAGIFVVHPVLGTMVVSALLAPGQSNSLALDWQEMDGVRNLQRRYAAWQERDAEVRRRIRDPLVPSLVALIGGGMAAAVLGASAAGAERRAVDARKDAIEAAARGQGSSVAAAWDDFNSALSDARGLRVGASVAGGFSAAGLGFTIGFGVRGAALRRTVPAWDPWSVEQVVEPAAGAPTPEAQGGTASSKTP